MTSRAEPPLEVSAPVARASKQAVDEAVGLRHKYVGTEHLLLGLLRGGGDVTDFLRELDVRYDGVRDAVRQILRQH